MSTCIGHMHVAMHCVRPRTDGRTNEEPWLPTRDTSSSVTRGRAYGLLDRFWAKVDVTPNGCWLWTGAKDDTGYGLIAIAGRNERTHRYAYSQLVGPIPGGLESDHLCRNRACANPEHIELVTKTENLARRGRVVTRGERLAPLDPALCSKGHPWEENTKMHGDGHRRCGACAKERESRRRARKALPGCWFHARPRLHDCGSCRDAVTDGR